MVCISRLAIHPILAHPPPRHPCATGQRANGQAGRGCAAEAGRTGNGGRIQTVTDESNPQLEHLLRRFNELTGVPCLINTRSARCVRTGFRVHPLRGGSAHSPALRERGA
ncbi:carbamoyltransferase C-terminal domain-containing protein [Streptomyces sp. CBMAI 2042]|uniref:carbamoyltransferase C-terminal domain-containing protein n=1 Tax=Streptomyces sp. CBMAI 2042 TaxID=2305222 RepID=UPI001F32B74E|nr:carbamoyltransferase C-terminal domain-containing protein [Streptomyces sp. CBMAI 2042]